jgi:hypothetical protein
MPGKWEEKWSIFAFDYTYIIVGAFYYDYRLLKAKVIRSYQLVHPDN